MRCKVVAVVAFAVASNAGTASGATLTVPVDVAIPVVLTAAVTSSTAHVGDAFDFKTAKDEKLGAIVVPAGSPGHGRLAVATPAGEHRNGSLSLQADTIDLPDGNAVSVNMDVSKPPRGHLSERTTRWRWIPIVVGVVPVVKTRVRGDLILEAGTGFGVITTMPRSVPAPLVTATPAAGTPPLPSPLGSPSS